MFSPVTGGSSSTNKDYYQSSRYISLNTWWGNLILNILLLLPWQYILFRWNYTKIYNNTFSRRIFSNNKNWKSNSMYSFCAADYFVLHNNDFWGFSAHHYRTRTPGHMNEKLRITKIKKTIKTIRDWNKKPQKPLPQIWHVKNHKNHKKILSTGMPS